MLWTHFRRDLAFSLWLSEHERSADKAAHSEVGQAAKPPHFLIHFTPKQNKKTLNSFSYHLTQESLKSIRFDRLSEQSIIIKRSAVFTYFSFLTVWKSTSECFHDKDREVIVEKWGTNVDLFVGSDDDPPVTMERWLLSPTSVSRVK